MTGQGRSCGWTWEGTGPTTWEPGPAKQNEFFPTKWLNYRQKYSSILSTVLVAGLRSCRWRSQMWRPRAGVVTHGLSLRLVGRTAKFSKTTLVVAYGREMNIQLADNSSGGIPIGHSPNLRHLWHCVVTKWHILEGPFVHSTRCTCGMTMLFNQLLDMPHLSCGWIILANEKCSLRGM